MNLLNLPNLPSNLHYRPNLHRPSPPSLKLSCFRSGGGRGRRVITNAIPARDRVIDFGKYKGQMLGTLPSNYLRWVSKNLLTRDFEDWKKLADEVLEDPVYRDRIEWELAHDVVSGDGASSVARIGGGEQPSAVEELMRISQRFGWDFEDKIGWGKVDFALLGTTKGGRIPRLSDSGSRSTGEPKPRQLKKKEGDGGGRRERRRERIRSARTSPSVAADERNQRMAKREIPEIPEGNFGSNPNEQQQTIRENRVRVGSESGTTTNPFPGRESLLKKVISSKRLS